MYQIRHAAMPYPQIITDAAVLMHKTILVDAVAVTVLLHLIIQVTDAVVPIRKITETADAVVIAAAVAANLAIAIGKS